MQPPAPDRSITSSSRHRRQTFWQILLPVILAAGGVIALMILLSLGAANGSSASGQWAAIAAIWMVLPVMGAVFLFTALTVAVIVLVARLTHLLPTYTRLAQLYVQIAGVKMDTFLNRISRPQITFLSWWTGLRSIGKRSRSGPIAPER